MEKMSEELKAKLIAEIQSDPLYSEEVKDKMICKLVSDGKWITMHEYNYLKGSLEYTERSLERAKAEIKRLKLSLKAAEAKYNELAGIEDNPKEPGKIIYMNK